MIIGIDFDGTCVTHAFPEVGEDIGAIPVLQELVERGHKLVLWTMRHDHTKPSTSTDPEIHTEEGMYLTHAIIWFYNNKIPLWGIQTNPEQHTWTGSPKAYCHRYIDDAGLGCPLVKPEGERPYADWKRIRELLVEEGIL